MAKIFGVNGIPTFVILDENGETITKEGRMKISQEGAAGYPFKPDPVKVCKSRDRLRDSNNEANHTTIGSSEAEGIRGIHGKSP